MEKFRNTKRLTENQINDTLTYPIFEGNSYFATDTEVLYKDIDGYRIKIATVKFTLDYMSGYNPSQTKIRSCLIIDRVIGDPTPDNDVYNLWFIDSDGTANSISSGTSGTTYTPGDGIDIIANAISVDSTVLRNDSINWILDYLGDTDFTIQDKNDSNKKIFTIYKTSSGSDPDVKVKIDAKTTISELDFGGW